MMQRFSYEHNFEHSRSKLNAQHPKLVGKIYLESIANYANLVIEVIYKLWHNCSSHGNNIEHNRQFFEHCSKA